MTTCDSCGIRLDPECLRIEDEPYCCAGCAAGGPCNCTYEQDLGRFPPSHYARRVSFADLLDRYERGIQTTAQAAVVTPPPAPEDVF